MATLEHPVYIISNGSLTNHPHNTLSNFTNDVYPSHLRPDSVHVEDVPPKQLAHAQQGGRVEESKPWEVCLSEVAFHVKFRNQYAPAKDCTDGQSTAFSLALFPSDVAYLPEAQLKQEWDVFPQENRFYMPSDTMATQELANHIVAAFNNPYFLCEYTRSISRLSFKYRSTGRNAYVYKGLSLWMHESFFKFFTHPEDNAHMNDVKGRCIRRTVVDDNVYYIFPLKRWKRHFIFPRRLESAENLPRILPKQHSKLVLLECPQLKMQTIQNLQRPVLGHVTLGDDAKGYQHYEFTHKIFYPLQETQLKHITLKLVDHQTKEPVPLCSGPPTIAKLIFRRRRQTGPIPSVYTLPVAQKKTFGNLSPMFSNLRPDIVVRVTSENHAHHQNNTKSAFKVALPHDKVLPEGSYHVALLSMSYPTRTKIPLSEAERTITVELTTIDHQDVESTETIGDFVVPAESNTPESIATTITSETSNMIKATVKKSEHGYSNGKLVLSLTPSTLVDRVKAEVIMSKKFIKYLNGNQPHGKLCNKEDENTMEVQGISVKADEPFEMAEWQQVHFPSNLIVYSDLVVPTPFGGRLSNVLKIVPQSHISPREGYITKEFMHLDFHELTLRKVSELSFEIRDHGGQLIPFVQQEVDDKEPVVLTLLFSTNY